MQRMANHFPVIYLLSVRLSLWKMIILGHLSLTDPYMCCKISLNASNVRLKRYLIYREIERTIALN